MTTTTAGITPPAIQHDKPIARARRVRNGAWWAGCTLALLLVVAPVVWILEGVVEHAVAGWKWDVLWTTSTGIGGGLANAIVGTFVIMIGVALVAGSLGIGAGIYLVEFSHPGIVQTVLRSATEILAGVPSIVFGYCGYLALVIGLHWGFSLLPAVIVLSLLVTPYVSKSTELALGQVPVANREGGEALGMRKTYVLRRVVFRAALPGILTGLIIALAISAGETAPLIYTAGFSNLYPSGALIHSQVGYLTYAAYAFYDEPSATAQALSRDASLLLVLLVLALILSARLAVRVTQRFSPNRSASRPRRGRRRGAVDGAAAVR